MLTVRSRFDVSVKRGDIYSMVNVSGRVVFVVRRRVAVCVGFSTVKVRVVVSI